MAIQKFSRRFIRLIKFRCLVAGLEGDGEDDFSQGSLTENVFQLPKLLGCFCPVQNLLGVFPVNVPSEILDTWTLSEIHCQPKLCGEKITEGDWEDVPPRSRFLISVFRTLFVILLFGCDDELICHCNMFPWPIFFCKVEICVQYNYYEIMNLAFF